MNVMGDVIFDTLRNQEGGHVGLIMSWDSSQSFGCPLLVKTHIVLLFLVSNNVVCLHRTAAYHKSKPSWHLFLHGWSPLHCWTQWQQALVNVKRKPCLGQSVSDPSKQTALAKQCMQLLKGFLKTLTGRTLYSLQEGYQCRITRE